MVRTGSEGRGARVKYVSSLFLPAAYWPPPAISGNLEVGVHIADVSYFVLEETALDKVASERATSVYLVQKVRTAFPFHLTTLPAICHQFTLKVRSQMSVMKIWLLLLQIYKREQVNPNSRANIAADYLRVYGESVMWGSSLMLCLWAGTLVCQGCSVQEQLCVNRTSILWSQFSTRSLIAAFAQCCPEMNQVDLSELLLWAWNLSSVW